MKVCSIWPFAQISDDFYYLGIWQCARYFVAALFTGVSFNYPQRNVRSRSRTSRSRSRLLWQSLGLVSKLEPGLGLCLGGYGLDSRLHRCHYPAGYPTGKPDSDHLCVGGVQELEFRTRSGLRPES